MSKTKRQPLRFFYVRLEKCNQGIMIFQYSLLIIISGEKCDVTLHVRVDKKTAGPLTSGQDQLYDILVLHLVGGKDIFITVSGEYQRSSFGASIDALVRMTVPICELTTASILQLEGMYYR